MPDYKLQLWDTKRFDIHSNNYVKQAVENKKWAFAADYIRLYALYTEGGIYLDSDVIIKRRLDRFLEDDFFSAVEYHPTLIKNLHTAELLNEDGSMKDPATQSIPGIGIQAAIMGSIPGHSFVKECLSYYEKKDFNPADIDMPTMKNIAPTIYAQIAQKYGFVYKNKKQILSNGVVIYPTSVFASNVNEIDKKVYAIHGCKGTWYDNTICSNPIKKIYHKIGSSRIVRKIRGKKSILADYFK